LKTRFRSYYYYIAFVKYKQLTFFAIFLAASPIWAYLDTALFPDNILYYRHLMYVSYLIFGLAVFNNGFGLATNSIGGIILSLLLLFLYYLLRSHFSTVGQLNWLYISSYRWVIPMLLYILVIYNSEIDQRIIEYLILFIKITIILAAVISLIQLTIDRSFFEYQIAAEKMMINTHDDYTRYQSIFSFLSPNDLGFSFLSISSILIGYLILIKEKYSRILLWILIISIVALLSNARYVIFGFFIVVSQIFFKEFNFRNIFRNLFILFLTITVIYLTLSYIGFDINQYITDKILSSKSNSSRIISFFVFLKYFPQNPMFGTGVRASAQLWNELGGSDNFMQIHIGYLSHLYEFGLIGSLFLFSFYFFVLKKLYITKKLTGFSGGYFAMLIFLFANLTLVEYSMFFYGLMIVFIFDSYYSQKDETS
jgi:hypothetical protein